VKLVAFVLAIAACGAPRQNTETLADSVRSYNDGVRWQRFSIAASRLPADERSRFVDDMDARAKDVQITDYEVLRIDERGDREARVQVKMSWFHAKQQIVRETHAMQSWERHGKLWFMVDETFLRGDQMPGLVDRHTDETTPNPE
jgi:hypothetical protein